MGKDFCFLWVLGRKRVGRLESNQQKRCLLTQRLSMQSVRCHTARKGRPPLRSHSPVFPWARSYRLPYNVAYFVPVCKRACVGLLLSCLYHPSFGWRGEFLISLVVTSIVAGQVPSLLGQVHPGASSQQCSQIGLPPIYALDRMSSPFISWTSMFGVSGAYSRDNQASPRLAL